MQKSIDEIKIKIAPILEKYGVKKTGIFDSYARGEAMKGSDIDILVEFKKSIGLIDLISAEMEMSDALSIKVDLLTEKSISPYLIENIRKETFSI